MRDLAGGSARDNGAHEAGTPRSSRFVPAPARHHRPRLAGGDDGAATRSRSRDPASGRCLRHADRGCHRRRNRVLQLAAAAHLFGSRRCLLGPRSSAGRPHRHRDPDRLRTAGIADQPDRRRQRLHRDRADPQPDPAGQSHGRRARPCRGPRRRIRYGERHRHPRRRRLP